jgi:hypothetical protein
MASQIDQNTIDATYPVAGQDNSSQGFRDNFSAIQTNFGYAYTEISSLQANAVIRNQDNDLGGNTTVTNGIFRSSRETIYAIGSVSGNIPLNYANGSYQTITLTGSVVMTFNGFSVANGSQTRIRLQVTITDTDHTLTIPAAVNINKDTIAGISGNTIYFQDPGTYIFEFSTNDGGTSYAINDLVRPRNEIQGNITLVTAVNNAAQAGITMTVSNIDGSANGTITCNTLITGNLVSSANSASFSGNVTAEYFIANVGYVGNILTNAQTNITSVGTLEALSVSGNANVGNLTVTGITDMCGGTVFGLQFVANAADGSSTQIYSNVGAVIVAPNATIAAYTITMPATPMDGQIIKISFANTITTLTHTVVGGQTLNGGFATANANVGGEWMFYSNVWYKTS